LGLRRTGKNRIGRIESKDLKKIHHTMKKKKGKEELRNKRRKLEDNKRSGTED